MRNNKFFLVCVCVYQDDVVAATSVSFNKKINVFLYKLVREGVVAYMYWIC